VEIKIRDAVDYVTLKAQHSGRLVFRLPKGKSPIIIKKYLVDHRKYEKEYGRKWMGHDCKGCDILFDCFYLKSGHSVTLHGDEIVVPLKLQLEDDEYFFDIRDTKGIDYSYLNEEMT